MSCLMCVKGNTFLNTFLTVFAILKKKCFKAIQEVKRNWIKPTEGQMQELEFLQKNRNKAKVK